MSDVITITDLEETKKHNTFHVDVITGRTGDYATNAVTGQVQKTLPATIDGLDWSYVGKFADGVTFTKSTDFAIDANNTQWIYVGASPFPVVVPPATVPSAPDYQVVHVGSLQALGGLTEASDLDTVFARTFAGESAMVAFSGHRLGNKYLTFEGGKYTVYEVVNSSSDVDLGGGFWAQADSAYSANISNTHEQFVGVPPEEFTVEEMLNYSPNRTFADDYTVGGSLSSIIDSCPPQKIKVSRRMSGGVIDDVTISRQANSVQKSIFRKFSVTGKTTGNVKYAIYTEANIDFYAGVTTIPVGTFLTPFSSIKPVKSGYANFVRVKKGVGQGKISIELQFTRLGKSNERVRKVIEVIDLDDGQPVRDYDLILPEISGNTMNGFAALVDGKPLTYILGCPSDSAAIVNIVGIGSKRGDGALVQHHTGELLTANLPVNGAFRLPEVDCPESTTVKVQFTRYAPGVSATLSELVLHTEY